MRRTQRVTSYVTLFLLLIGGVGLMVLFLVQDGFIEFAEGFVNATIAPNLPVIGGVSAVLFLITFYLILRTQFRV
jgi:hypothetical protein